MVSEGFSPGIEQAVDCGTSVNCGKGGETSEVQALSAVVVFQMC